MNYETYRQLKADPNTDILNRTPSELQSYMAWEEDMMKAWSGLRVLAEVVNHTKPSVLADMLLGQMVTTHHHLQAELITTLWMFMRYYGNLDRRGFSDLRNADAMDLAKKMGEVTL